MISSDALGILTEKMHTYALLTENYMKQRTDLFYASTDLQTVADAVKPLFDSFTYSLFAGGKRLRPFLVLEFCRLCGGSSTT